GGGDRGTQIEERGDLGRDFDFLQMAERGINRGIVLLYDGLAALAVGLLDGVFDGGDGFVARQDAGDGEEAGLHDGVDAAAHACELGYFVAVDDVEIQLFGDDLVLHQAGQLVPDGVGIEGAVEEEGGAGFSELQHVDAFQEGEL